MRDNAHIRILERINMNTLFYLEDTNKDRVLPKSPCYARCY